MEPYDSYSLSEPLIRGAKPVQLFRQRENSESSGDDDDKVKTMNDIENPF